MKTDSGLNDYCHGNADFRMYGSDAGQPAPSLYTKGLSPLCDMYIASRRCIIMISLVSRNSDWLSDTDMLHIAERLTQVQR